MNFQGCNASVDLKALLEFILDSEWRKVSLTVNFVLDYSALDILCLMLNVPEAIKELRFSSECIAQEGIIKLASALESNTTLTFLDLSENNIGEGEVLNAIANLLRHNVTLRQLILRSNQIDNNGAQTLSKAFPQNTTLTVLSLEWETINQENSVHLQNCVKINRILFTNEFWSPNLHNSFSKNFHKIVCASLLCNSANPSMNDPKNASADNSKPQLYALPDLIWWQIFSFLQRKNF